MKIILRENVENLGRMGEEYTVKNGYATNFLIPQGLAFPATDAYRNIVTSELKHKQALYEKEKQKAELLSKEMENVTVSIQVTVGEDDRMFGSVTASNIAEKLHEAGYNIDKKKIKLDEPIKALGIYHVAVKLHMEVSVDVKVWVIKETEEETEDVSVD